MGPGDSIQSALGWSCPKREAETPSWGDGQKALPGIMA